MSDDSEERRLAAARANVAGAIHKYVLTLRELRSVVTARYLHKARTGEVTWYSCRKTACA